MVLHNGKCLLFRLEKKNHEIRLTIRLISIFIKKKKNWIKDQIYHGIKFFFAWVTNKCKKYKNVDSVMCKTNYF